MSPSANVLDQTIKRRSEIDEKRQKKSQNKARDKLQRKPGLR